MYVNSKSRTAAVARESVLRSWSTGIDNQAPCSNCQLTFLDDEQIFDEPGYFNEAARRINNSMAASASGTLTFMPDPNPRDYLMKASNPSPSQQASTQNGSVGSPNAQPEAASPAEQRWDACVDSSGLHRVRRLHKDGSSEPAISLYNKQSSS
jgi:hypothetical protein